MKFADRLCTALFEGVLAEITSFTLPEPIPLPTKHGETVLVKYLDMRWEDYSSLVRQWGQWTPFAAALPVNNGPKRYLIWDGINAQISHQDVPEYYTAPEDWWLMAQGMDIHGKEVIRPKLMRAVEL